MSAYLNAVGTAVPNHDIHHAFIDGLGAASRPIPRGCSTGWPGGAGIAHRWSVLPPTETGGSPVEAGGLYAADPLPGTAARLALYSEAAPELAIRAIDALDAKAAIGAVTHLVVASCTGFVAPGIDQIIARRLGLSPSVERLLIGFMGCYAAVVALRSARHIVRSEPDGAGACGDGGAVRRCICRIPDRSRRCWRCCSSAMAPPPHWSLARSTVLRWARRSRRPCPIPRN